ncbi:MAG TPA: hypothetical protein DFR83_29275 [Deltaproteobacteria bacterium]|nr:hypothetical protein [Deltaproteobacteria bacterium]
MGSRQKPSGERDGDIPDRRWTEYGIGAFGGTVLHTDPRFVESVTSVVAEIERTTSAEVVVVAAGRSHSHAALGVRCGVVAAWLALLCMVVVPWEFSPEWMLLELPVLGGLVAWFVPRSERVVRTLLPSARAQRLVARAAAAAFTEEVVHGTRDRTGLLIYLSGVENQVAVIADGGIEACVPPGEWAALPWCGAPARPGPKELDAFLEGMRAIGQTLAAHLPADPDDNPDELPDAPRVRP